MKNKIKIMHLTLSMGYGGLERIINQFAKKAAKDNFEISICCLDAGGDLLDDLTTYNIKKFLFNRSPGILDLKLLLNLISLVRRERIEVIHSHSGCSFYAAIAGRLARVKGIIHTDHGRLVPDKKGLIFEDKIASMLINAYVSVSHELAFYLMNKLKIQKHKLITIINGIDTENFKPCSSIEIIKIKKELNIAEDSEIIGTVCRLDPVKNLIFMIQAFAEILKEHKQAKVLIVGEGPERKDIEDMIDKLDLNGKVVLLGEKKDVERIMPIFDIFILPSISEGTSITILEAMACGVPVVASMVGGNYEIVREGRNGFLFPLNKSDLLINRILELLKNKKKSKAMGKEGRRIVEREFSFNRMYEEYTELYLDLVSS